ncbi:MAG: divalent-cation tolerance protein CutA [Methylocystaceae bacterium]|nr:MAG: divalent-cation tolerance protein CutA [Methylocystaceae bacterium]
MDFCIVVTTTDTDESARRIAHAALDARLAACVQLFPIRSLYSWRGELRDEAEIFVQMKARVEDYDLLAEAIRAVHGYEVPEILRIDVADGDKAYLDWVALATARDGSGPLRRA